MIKKGLKVKILAGKDKTKEGEVIEIDRSKHDQKTCENNKRKKRWYIFKREFYPYL